MITKSKISDSSSREDRLVKTGKELILEALAEKAGTKQAVFKLTAEMFQQFKQTIKSFAGDLKKQIGKTHPDVDISYLDKGTYEAELKFSGDVLVFSMHTNVFTFDNDHFIHQSNYVEEDRMRAYCGMIQVHNFLSDSFKYNRFKDLGYLVARIFVNKEQHFFVEGKRQLGFLYNDFEQTEMNPAYMQAIIESVMLYAIDFDLLVPPYEQVKELSVAEKIEQLGISQIKTGKRLGFRFEADSDRIT
jgi:hypothetical protein